MTTVEAIDYKLAQDSPDIRRSRLRVVPSIGNLAIKETGSTRPDQAEPAILGLHRVLKMPLPFVMSSHEFEEWIIFGEHPNRHDKPDEAEAPSRSYPDMLVFPLIPDNVL